MKIVQALQIRTQALIEQDRGFDPGAPGSLLVVGQPACHAGSVSVGTLSAALSGCLDHVPQAHSADHARCVGDDLTLGADVADLEVFGVPAADVDAIEVNDGIERLDGR